MDVLSPKIGHIIYKNNKILSYTRDKTQIFNKMKNRSIILNLRKQFGHSSIMNYSMYNTNRSKESINWFNNIILPSQSKTKGSHSKLIKKYSSINNKINISKINQRDELSTSLSSLLKTNTYNYSPHKKNKSKSNQFIKPYLNNINNDSLNNNNYYFFRYSFNKDLDNILNINNSNESSYIVEKTRIIRKYKIINQHCLNKAKILQQANEDTLNKYDKFIINKKNQEKLFYIYIRTLKYYLNKLLDIKEEENQKLSKLKVKKYQLFHQIESIKNSIKIKKEILNSLKEKKQFLLEVKYGKSLSHLSQKLKMKYGFSVEKGEKNTKSPKKTKSFSIYKTISVLLNKKKEKKKKLDLNKRQSIQETNNEPIFIHPEEFMSSIDIIEDKINDKMIFYKTSRESVEKYKNNYKNITIECANNLKKYVPEEKRLLDLLNFEKNKNNIMNSKLNAFKKIIKNEKNTFIKIVSTLKFIILGINSKIIIKKKLDMTLWNLITTSQKIEIEDTNVAISISCYILKLLEIIVEDLIYENNKYKNNQLLKDDYRRILKEVGKQNNISRSKYKIFLEKQKREEKSRSTLIKLKKVRIGSLLKKHINYEDSIIKKNILKKTLYKNKKKELLNKKREGQERWFSFSYT